MIPTALARKARRVRRGVPVLMYHLVSDEPVPASFSRWRVTPQVFRRQVETLRRLRFSTVTAGDLDRALRGERPLPPRPVHITFDDGYVDCLRHAAPILQGAGMTATMYVVAGLVGGRSRWMADEGVDLPLLDRAGLRELEQAGVECQSHSLTHPRLATRPDAEVADELVRSREVLEDVTGHPVTSLAYPHGSYDDRVRAIAGESGYTTAYTTQPGKALGSDDLLALPRVKVDGRDRHATFVARVVTGQHVGARVRGLVRTPEGVAR
ncbi:polysaccharide deacetylase family protein [Oryzobacter terrae]|uniref:polysaccharide deacetylase family protein n=1 Tax=Oryzobacter terrae TaxID=1620385 RepID=UPI00366F2146